MHPPNDPNCTFTCVTYPDPDPSGYTILGRCQIGNLWSYAAQNNYRDSSAINIYITSWNTGFGNAAYAVGSNRMVLRYESLNGAGMIHEMGHCLGLFHIRGKGNGPSDLEHTTRVEFLPGGGINPAFNAKTADDEVVDTAANTEFSHGGTYPFIDANCDYFGTETDEIGIEYQITNEDVINAMSDAYECVDPTSITDGQGIRMREKIQSVTILSNTLTTIESLYEPYAGSYPEYYPHPQPWQYPLFQPGFNYRFVECECECEEPSPYYDTSFTYTNNSLLTINKDETDYSSIIHPNHSAIQIDLGVLCDSYGQNVRRCYNNWQTPPVIGGGVIVKFNDNIFNENVTIMPQDSTEINNPYLVDQLDPGLYNIIKNYNDGSTQETVVFKENNE